MNDFFQLSASPKDGDPAASPERAFANSEGQEAERRMTRDENEVKSTFLESGSCGVRFDFFKSLFLM
jgi:hypothetical protein